jgi:hypothetical protein
VKDNYSDGRCKQSLGYPSPFVVERKETWAVIAVLQLAVGKVNVQLKPSDEAQETNSS